tara:strand:- start:5066 stop:5350 length:285 start_codon:yes stop_codon:yes gene_type:complete
VKKHIQLYHDVFDHQPGDWIGCEVCDSTAVDVHHINPRGMGGSSEKDTPENLMALCRECHILFGDKKKYKNLLTVMHREKIKRVIDSLSSDKTI